MTAASVLVSVALPGGRRTDLRCGAGDMSITEPLRASEGQWEPHLRAFFERTVRPDWVCFDIGANIGIHALGLAVLAEQGRIVAFEADPQNLAWLQENVERCPEPRGTIDIVAGALWDTDGTMSVASFDELAGCSFVSTTGAGDDSERRIRNVLAGGAVEKWTLTTRMSEVRLHRLDDWVGRQTLSRLDLVKIDIEGAEIQALGGAKDTLARFRPMLVTEYNPACGASYYGHSPSAYLDLLSSLYPNIRILWTDGSLSGPITCWGDLEEALGRHAFVDLICTV